MPASLTAQYRAAEARWRGSSSPADKRAALEVMLSCITKHRGTERLQADIKRRLARLRHEAEHRAAKRGQSFHVPAEGAGQVVLLGPPNSGKSSLLAALTRAEPEIADYPFTTTRPQPGLMLYEDIQIQLVDLPPVTADHMEPWLPGILQGADAALLLADPSTKGVLVDLEAMLDRLDAVHIPLVRELPEEGDPRDMPLRTVMVVTKVDRAQPGDAEVLQELYEERFKTLFFSATSGTGHQALKRDVWRLLDLVRVYTKPVGKQLERSDPFVLPSGSTVLDLAGRIHQDLPEKLASARVWGGKIQGQRVARDFELRDRDVVELAT